MASTVLAVGAAPMLSAQGAVPGASGGGFLRVQADDNVAFMDFAVTEDTSSAMLDQQIDAGGFRRGQSLANLNIVYEGSIFVDAQTATNQTNDNNLSFRPVLANVFGVLNVHSRLVFKAPPPFVSDRYPATLFVPYAMTDFGTPHAAANVTMRVYDTDDAQVFGETRTLGVDPAEGQYVLPSVLVEPDDPFRIELTTSATSSASPLEAVGVTVFSEAQAVIGTRTFSFPPPDRPGQNLPALPAPTAQGVQAEIRPNLTIEFDQAAFDAIHGANSYLLEDFLEFEFSTTLVPFFLSGDYNGSSQVEQGDLDLVLQNWGQDSAGNVPDGWTNDLPEGLIEQNELDKVLQNWGSTSAPDSGNRSVPEPAGLAALGVVGLLGKRRRRAAG